ncbi:MAG: transposase [bacterium]|nr:transposase [bacterium]
MDDGSVKKSRGRPKKDPIKEEDLQRFKLIHKFMPMLKDLHGEKDCHNRKLHCDQYISLVLFYFFNPILTSLRGICQVSHLKKVKKMLGIKGASLTSLSEAAGVFDADLIAPLIKQLARKAIPLEKDPELKDLQQALVAVDGTLLPALPKMLWALWLDDNNRAAKLHLEFDILKSAPLNARITDGNGNEKTALRGFLSSDKLYVLDAGYNEYKLFDDIMDAGSSFVARLRDDAVWDTLEDKPLTDDDKEAGIKRDMVVRLGCKDRQDDLARPVRVVEVLCKGISQRPKRSKTSGRKAQNPDGSDLICQA